tara:strand:- start:385 stop:633 length:249 start_codon:yes stop_codon:yes gene_type:complete
MADDFEVRGRIPRTATEEIKIKTGTYWNIPIVDIRWHKDGKPTRKGIRINMTELKHLSNILGRINDGERTRNKKNNQENEEE